MRNDARPIGHQSSEVVNRREEESVPFGVRPQFGGERESVGSDPTNFEKAGRPGDHEVDPTMPTNDSTLNTKI
jgi:hypothetical protein